MMRILVLLVLTTGATQQSSILAPPTDVTGKVGEIAQFMCSVEFGNIKIMSWEFNMVTIYSYQYGQEEYPKGRIKYQVVQNGRNFTLRVNNLHFADGGKYTCTGLSVAETAQLIVIDTPQIISLTQNPVEGDKAKYICSVQFGGPKKEEISPEHYPKLQMFFDGAPLNGTTDEQQSGDSGNCYNITQIQNITLEASMHGKPLSCEITTSSKENHVNITTEVMVLLHRESLETGNGTTQHYSILTPPHDATKKVGGTAQFMCSVKFQNTMIMSWEFNTVTIYTYQDGQEEYPKGNTKYQVVQDGRNFTLKVNDLHFTDGGKYTCTVLSEAEEALLIVIDTPKIYTSAHNPMEGSTAEYICTAQFGGPKKEEISPQHYPKLQMFFDGTPLNGTVDEQDSGNSGDCYNVTQIWNITLEAGMHGKPLSCEITSSKEKNIKIMTEVMVLFHPSSGSMEIDAKKIAAGAIILVCIVFGCLAAWCLYKRHRKQSSKTESYKLVETKSDCEKGIQGNMQGNIASKRQKKDLTTNEQMRGLITSTAEWIACKSDTMQEKGTLENSKPVCWDLDLINRLKLLLKEGADPAWSPKDSSDGSNLHVFLKVIKQVIFSKDHLILDLLELLEMMMTESSVASSNIDRDGKTILHVLVDGPRKDEIPLCSEMLQKLILFVANRNPDLFNAKDNSGCTPLHIFVASVLRGYQDTSELPSDPILFIHSVKTLASAANIDIQNEGKQTALHIFVELATDWVNNAEEFLKVVKLLKSSTNTSLRDWQGKTALQIFSKSGYTWQYCSEMFLSVFNELYNPAIINISHKDGGTVVDVFSSWAIDLAYHPKALLEIIDIFIFPGSLDAQDDSGDTMLHKYISSSMGWKHYPEESLEIVKRLRSPTNIAIKNINGETPLHIIHHGSDGFRDCPATMSLKVVKCLKSDSKKLKYPAKKAKKVFRAAKGYMSHT